MMKFWLVKSEPSEYSIDDLQRDRTTSWGGVRNYQARNFLRDQMKPGEKVLFYASSADPSGVTGIAEVARAGYPDPSQFRKGDYFEAKASPAKPIWFAVDLRFLQKFPAIVTLSELKSTKGLENMMVTKRGARLSVQPVTQREFDIVTRLASSR